MNTYYCIRIHYPDGSSISKTISLCMNVNQQPKMAATQRMVRPWQRNIEKFCKSSSLRLIFSFIGHKGKLTNIHVLQKNTAVKIGGIFTYSNSIQTSWFDLYDLAKSISIRKRRLPKNECSEFSLQDRQKPNIFYPLWKLNTICQIR